MVKSLDHHWQKPVGSIKEGNGIKEEEPEASQLLDEEMSDTLDAILLDEDDDDETDKKGGKAKGVNGRGKALLSTYEPDKRCESWLKVKKDYVDGIGDSLDLVPIGGEQRKRRSIAGICANTSTAWHGTGRKSPWWSPILLALYDPETGTYQAVCKCISGFTDAEYKSMKFERYERNNNPDVKINEADCCVFFFF